jgi:hypothetical protein
MVSAHPPNQLFEQWIFYEQWQVPISGKATPPALGLGLGWTGGRANQRRLVQSGGPMWGLGGEFRRSAAPAHTGPEWQAAMQALMLVDARQDRRHTGNSLDGY